MDKAIQTLASVQVDDVVFKIGNNGLGIDIEKYGDKLFRCIIHFILIKIL